MSSEAPQAEPTRTRRSSRAAAAPAAASAGASRAELRRRATTSIDTRPAIVWGREDAAPAQPTTAEQRIAAVEPAAPVVDTTPKHAASPASSRRSRRSRDEQPPVQPEAAAAPESSAIALPETPVALPEPVAAAPEEPQPLTDQASVEPRLDAASPSPAETPFAPTSHTAGRRARRARLKADQPTELPEAVLRPAEPFELLPPAAAPEPVVAPEQAIVAEPVPDGPVVLPAADVVLEPVEVVEHAATEPESLPDAHALPEEQARQGAASGVDEFAAAAALFSFTGETPVQAEKPVENPAADDTADGKTAEQPAKAPSPRVPRTRTSLRRIAATGFSVGVMGIVGLMTVGMTTPVEAVAASSAVETNLSVLAASDTEAGIDVDEIQAYVAPADNENADLLRDENYDTVTMAEIASESGISNYSSFFVNDPNSEIQWPFAVGVPISYGFGMRSGRMHEGVDFVPGYGAPIQAIADGTVRVATNAGGAYGVHVIIDHEIDGQLVSSHYAHMVYGSITVVPGQQVEVGQVLGNTGNTGRSYGAHTHFEILMNGTTAIDPIPWLRQHAGG
ncbi:peptidoglycan DD-metalloendopeptidase family protein [Microbacter sp. GSS18]|nr:peptidoglycan DD-metalloendopeptidase family protein [Microbacter sp. GSS18]